MTASARYRLKSMIMQQAHSHRSNLLAIHRNAAARNSWNGSHGAHELVHTQAALLQKLIKVGGSLYPADLCFRWALQNCPTAVVDRTPHQPTCPDTSWPARTVAPALRYDARWQAGRMVFPWPLQPQPQRLVLCSLTRSVGSSCLCNGAAGENCAQGCNNSASASGQGGAKPSPRR